MISLSHVPFKCKCKKYAKKKKKKVTAEQPKEIQKDLTRGQKWNRYLRVIHPERVTELQNRWIISE